MSTSTCGHTGTVYSGLDPDDPEVGDPVDDTEWHTAFSVSPADASRSAPRTLNSGWKHRAFVRLGTAGEQPTALADAADTTGWKACNGTGYPWMYSQSFTVNEPAIGGVMNFVTMTIRAKKTSSSEYCRMRPYIVFGGVGYERTGVTWDHENQSPDAASALVDFQGLTTAYANYAWTWALDPTGTTWTPSNIAAAHWGLLVWFPWMGGGTSEAYVTEITLVVDYSAAGGAGSRMRLSANPSRCY